MKFTGVFFWFFGMAKVVEGGSAETDLTGREIECLEWLGRGLDNDAIAKQIGISIPTVALHLANARKRLGAASREQALVLALQRGFINP